jgi:hypothetical protein
MGRVVRWSLIISVMLCAVIFFCISHAAPTEGFSKVTAGMTEAEVRQFLGHPLSVRHHASDGTVLYYGGFQRLKWCTMEIFLGRGGRVMGTFHDH